MSAIRRQRVWSQKPLQSVSLNWANQLTQGLVVCLPLQEGAGPTVDPLSTSWTLGGNTGVPSWTTLQNGTAAKFNGSNQQWFLGPAAPASLAGTGWTVAWGTVNTEATTFSVVLGNSTGSGYISSVFMWSSNPGFGWYDSSGSAHFTNAPSSASQQNYHDYALQYNGTTSAAWVDGVPVSIVSDFSGKSMGWGTLILGSGNTSGNYSYDGLISYCYVWNRLLSAAEIVAFQANPWQLFAPAAGQWRWRGASGGGSVTVNVGAVFATGFLGGDGVSLITSSAAVLATGYAGVITAGPSPSQAAVAATGYAGVTGAAVAASSAAVLATGYAGVTKETIAASSAAVLATGYVPVTSETLTMGAAAVLATTYAPTTGVLVIIAGAAPLATGYVGGTSVVVGGTVVVSAGAVSAGGVVGVAGVDLIMAAGAVSAGGYAATQTAGPSPGAAAVAATAYSGATAETVTIGVSAVKATGYVGVVYVGTSTTTTSLLGRADPTQATTIVSTDSIDRTDPLHWSNL